MNKNQKGFSVIEGLLILIIVGILGGTGWYVWHTQQNTDKSLSAANNTSNSIVTTPKKTDKTTYDTAKAKNILNFGSASESLKAALINTYYDDAKKNCDQENAGVSAGAQLKYVMVVQKMVRDDFAKIQFCGSGGSSILVHVNGEWKKVGSLAMAPACSLVDQYKISKEITATCYVDGSSNIRGVTYP